MAAHKEELSGWVATQHRTFTRWCNMVLAKNKGEKTEMQGLVHPNDFASGYVLMMLLETLVPGSKQFKSDHEKGQIKNTNSTRFVKLDAVSRALAFLKDHEKLNLVNIGPTDIVDSNLKITLGFVWQLILKYQIADNSTGDAEAAKAAAKKNLLAWVNNLITPLGVDPVNNFGKDWNTGLALCALNEASYPELQDLDKCKVRASAAAGRLENCREALNNAVNKMGLPKLIEPEDMAAAEPDELSMMTLISVYKENITRIKGMRNTDLEAAAAKQREEEERRRLAEEEERRRREEEERRRQEEERRRREEEEERRRREEEEQRRRREEEERKRREEEEAARRRREEEEARRLAEEEARRLAEEEARRKAEEEARHRAEAEAARKRAEEEARRRAEEEEARRRAQQQQQHQPPKKLFVMSFLSKALGCYITAHDNGSVVCNTSVAKQWEYIIVEPLDHTGVPVRLRSWHGKYIHHNPDGTVSQYAPGQGPQTDIWYLTREPDQTCIIRTNDGGVLNADAGWGGSVICRQDDGSVNVNISWRGTKIKAVSLRGYFGKFLSVSKKGEVKADQTNPGDNESFTLERAPTPNGPGKCYYMKSYHGKYLTAEIKKGHVECKAEKPNEWEMFWFEKRGEKRGVEGDAVLRSYHGKYLGVQKDSTFSKGVVEANRDVADDWEKWTVFQKDLSRGKDSNIHF